MQARLVIFDLPHELVPDSFEVPEITFAVGVVIDVKLTENRQGSTQDGDLEPRQAYRGGYIMRPPNGNTAHHRWLTHKRLRKLSGRSCCRAGWFDIR